MLCGAADVQVELDGIEDVRAPKKPNSLHVGVKMSGEPVERTAKISLVVETARDDTGASLRGEKAPDFSIVTVKKDTEPKSFAYLLTANLFNPARKATQLAGFSGDPLKKVAAIVLFGPSGQRIKAIEVDRYVIGDRETRIFHLKSGQLDGLRVHVATITAKSTVEVPVSFRDVPLP